MDLEIAIINLISQIPMSIWLYNDGRTIVASTVGIGSDAPAATGEHCPISGGGVETGVVDEH